jgi:hypothetical protein
MTALRFFPIIPSSMRALSLSFATLLNAARDKANEFRGVMILVFFETTR